MSEEYKTGFDLGFEWALKNFDANTGNNLIDLPDWFHHRGDTKSCGFGEGLISGRSEKIAITFGSIRSIHWENEKAVVEY